jgi:RraA family protein
MTHSFTFGELPPAPARAIIDELRDYEVAWISDSMELNLMDREIRPVWRGAPRLVGPAVTVTVPPGDFVMIAAALKEAREGDVLVIDGRGDTSRAVWGDYFSSWARDLGIRGVVIDGATRDAGGIEVLGLPVFARTTTPRKPILGGYGEVNVPVSCGGVCVLPGDIVVGDGEGVIVLPLRHLDGILARVRETAKRERGHQGVPTGGREDYDAFFDAVFARKIMPKLSDAAEPQI